MRAWRGSEPVHPALARTRVLRAGEQGHGNPHAIRRERGAHGDIGGGRAQVCQGGVLLLPQGAPGVRQLSAVPQLHALGTQLRGGALAAAAALPALGRLLACCLRLALFLLPSHAGVDSAAPRGCRAPRLTGVHVRGSKHRSCRVGVRLWLFVVVDCGRNVSEK
jgi:hypothetical protein